MRNARRSSPPPAAISERLTSGRPSLASDAATMRSHASAISRPPATAKPSMAAMSGLRGGLVANPPKPRSPTTGASPCRNPLRSIPALKPGPSPRRIPRRSCGSASSSSMAAASSRATWPLTALRASGRFTEMISTRSSRAFSVVTTDMRRVLPGSGWDRTPVRAPAGARTGRMSAAGGALRLAAQHLHPRERALVDLVRAVGDAQRPLVGPEAGEREVVGHAAAAVDLDRPVDDLERHVRSLDLDRGDLGAGLLVADRVHQPRGLEDEQSGRLDLDAGLGDPVLD